MTSKVRDYFNKKYDKENSPAFLEGVLRTIGEVPREEDEIAEPEVVEK